jgi:predicted nucleotidyltransferase
MMLSETDRRVVETFKTLMRERGLPVRETIVFGSRARGDADQDSDLDVLVIVDSLNREIRNEISDCAWEAGFEAGIILQSIVMTCDEIENSPQRSSIFVMAVRRDGVSV